MLFRPLGLSSGVGRKKGMLLEALPKSPTCLPKKSAQVAKPQEKAPRTFKTSRVSYIGFLKGLRPLPHHLGDLYMSPSTLRCGHRESRVPHLE